MKTLTKLSVVLMLVAFSITNIKAQKNQSLSDLRDIGIQLENEGHFELTEEVFTEDANAEFSEDIRVSRRYRKVKRGRRFFDDRDIDKYYPRRGTQNFINIYVGLNNYLQDGELPNSNSILSLQPLNSWYLGLNFDNVTHVFGPLYLDWGAGVSVQNFSFENTRTRVIKGPDSISFTEEATVSGKKSKLTMSHINLHFVPTISFGRYRSFRVGFGGYAGYRIGSHVKYKYDDVNGNNQKDKEKDNWFINPFRYGARATVGWDFFDLFVNYDLTELFEDDINAPRLNPVTFGVIF
ncbi:outer membrane beta-barrel protein [Roseivirga misakiensis]|uniref:Outer membrane protein beta-barrel domain-containing protein n=1 Tax=Roseivirga misakiensis TaxID=1563681 RepID=A0A1E5SK23_9BACT|nr:outer membrane beta-barrel protein [Roseivirga misakiensis]OEJ99470.1 hypothetical protein BFP71_07740 [Roseivirga misakiensis]